MVKNLLLKKPAKDKREQLVLLALVELYLETGKPISSGTLKNSRFDHLSSATIRNYFGKLEEEGFLKQQHSSGGRIPTHKAYQAYVDHYLSLTHLIDEKEKKALHTALFKETREIATYLQSVAEVVSESSRCAVFLSAPRFDQDFVLDVKLVGIDHNRLLCILITDFGLVQTELLYADKKLTLFNLKRLEHYFRWKLTGLDRPKLQEAEEALAAKFYSEVMLRHLVSHSQFPTEDIYKTGFSKLLAYADFNDATALAAGLGLFEDKEKLRHLLQQTMKKGSLCCWVGDELESCSAIAIPYRINQTVVGSIAILGPNRIPYRRLFGILQTVSESITEALTKSMYKFKISFRLPQKPSIGHREEQANIQLLLENKNEP